MPVLVYSTLAPNKGNGLWVLPLSQLPICLVEPAPGPPSMWPLHGMFLPILGPVNIKHLFHLPLWYYSVSAPY